MIEPERKKDGQLLIPFEKQLQLAIQFKEKQRWHRRRLNLTKNGTTKPFVNAKPAVMPVSSQHKEKTNDNRLFAPKLNRQRVERACRKDNTKGRPVSTERQVRR